MIIQSQIKGSWIYSAKRYTIESNVSQSIRILHAELIKMNGSVNKTCIAIYDDMEYHNIDGEFHVSSIKDTIFVCLNNQLGNCLRIISSAIIIAKYYKKNIFIDYDYPNLINKEKVIVRELFPHLCIQHCGNIYEKINYTDCVSYTAYNSTNYHLIDEGRLLELPNSNFNNFNNFNNNFGITESIYSILPSTVEYSVFNREKVELYKNIRYPALLLENITSFLKTHPLENCVGLHIRYSDNLNDINKQKYNTEKEVFYKRIDELVQENATIFLCSDNETVIQECQDRIPKGQLVLPNRCSNILHQALYEMLLLSKTRRIIGSNSSTFSYESAYMSGTLMELFESGVWNLYDLGI